MNNLKLSIRSKAMYFFLILSLAITLPLATSAQARSNESVDEPKHEDFYSVERLETDTDSRLIEKIPEEKAKYRKPAATAIGSFTTASILGIITGVATGIHASRNIRVDCPSVPTESTGNILGDIVVGTGSRLCPTIKPAVAFARGLVGFSIGFAVGIPIGGITGARIWKYRHE